MTQTKDLGFSVTRRRERRSGWWPRLLPRWVWLLALLALVWIAGLTRAWSQNSGSLSSSSESDLTTWNKLSERFQEALTAQSERLQQALKETETSKADLLKLTGLLEQSLQANGSLRSYNAQIAERMQQRDEDLAAAYEAIDRLQKNGLRHWIVHVVTAGIILGFLALKRAKFF